MKLYVRYTIGDSSSELHMSNVREYEFNHNSGFIEIEYHSGNTTYLKTDNIVLFIVEHK